MLRGAWLWDTFLSAHLAHHIPELSVRTWNDAKERVSVFLEEMVTEGPTAVDASIGVNLEALFHQIPQ